MTTRPVERADVTADPGVVLRRLADWSRPVVFSEASNPAFVDFVATWTQAAFESLVGDAIGFARHYPPGDKGPASQVEEMPLREILRRVARPDPPNYSTRLSGSDPRELTFSEPLFRDIRELCSRMPSLSWGGHVFDTVWFGGTKTVTPLHYDPVSRLHGVLRGVKRFTLYPPDRRHLQLLEVLPARSTLRNYSRIGLGPLDPELFPGLKEADAVDARLEAGDVLYIPPCWWHHVTIEEPLTITSSVAYRPPELYRLWAYWRLKIGSLLGR